MKKFYFLCLAIVFSLFSYSQQLPNANFEDWSGEKFDGNEQPKSWNASNVTQFGYKFNFAHKETGHSGYCMMVQGQDIGAAGITETSPGYFSLGYPWVYIENLFKVSEATAGTYGGINWTYRPDTMSVWIKRTGGNAEKEIFTLLYYAWSGTSKGNKYTGKNGNCTSTSKTDEESDIRQALDGNKCGTIQKANQIAEGLWQEKKEYADWVNIKVPILYMNNTVPEKMNIIFSASRYPEYRANSGIYAGNSLFIDDVELIYSASIQAIYFDDIIWNGFDPHSTDIQTYSLGENATSLPRIEARRGVGTITNSVGETVNFPGRVLQGKEISITNGEIDKTPTIITVTSDDGKKTHTYKIQFVRAASTNTKVVDIKINNTSIAGFNPNITAYTCELPYGTTQVPNIEVVKSEDKQQIDIKRPASLSDKAVITVTAADGKTKATYSLSFKIAELADNTLQDILICAKETETEPDEFNSIPSFSPSQTRYNVSIPLGTQIVKVKAVSAYPENAQTITYKAPSTLSGGTYEVSVTTPGNKIAKVYKLVLKEEKSTYALLKDLQMGNNLIKEFDPASAQAYYVNLPLGTTELPEITYVKGEKYQTVVIEKGGLDGTTKVIVTAAAGNQKVYKIIVSTEKSNVSTLKNIFLNGNPLPAFHPDTFLYDYPLPIGTTTLPSITTDNGDEYQTIKVIQGNLNGITRISVTAGDGTTTIYQIKFSVKIADNTHLKDILIDGASLENFHPDSFEYKIVLPHGTTILPEVSYTPGDEFQNITERPSGVDGDYKITVRAQNGTSSTYILHFSVEVSDIDYLNMIYLDGDSLVDFDPEKADYTDSLPVGTSTIPKITFDKGDANQKVQPPILEGNVIRITVTAENGNKKIYTITFIIQKSQNAFLKNIFLDKDTLEGFTEQELEYTVELQNDTIPAITVDKNEGQRVAILAPSGNGTAQIIVTPEEGEPNIYKILFVKKKEESLLQNILINNQPLPNFKPNEFVYNVQYEDTLPFITWENKTNQTVQMMRLNDTVSLYVKYEEKYVVYTLYFEKRLSSNCTLRNITCGDHVIENTDEFNHTITLPAGSEIPTISYQKSDPKQNVLFGSLSATQYQLTVTAPDGKSTHTYTINFNVVPFNDVMLENIVVPGFDTDMQFDPKTTEYTLNLKYGDTMPKPIITSKEGQITLLYNESENKQIISVIAQDGSDLTYEINYKYSLSSSPYLKNIYIGGKELEGFNPTTSNYEIELPWRSIVIPPVNTVPQNTFQQVKTTYCKVNDTLRIDVTAADSSTTFTYKIAFPVAKSNNTKLASIDLDPTVETFAFNPDITDYTITLPYQTTACPQIYYEKAEPEQNIRFISKPIYDTTKIIVTAENGNSAVYKLFFTAEEAEENNRLTMLRVRIDDNDELEQELSLKVKTQREFVVNVPFGSRSLVVEYEKAYPEQTVFVQPGGVNHPTILTVKANKANVADKVYTITPNLATEDPAVLTDINVNGTTIPGFKSETFSYIVPITSKPVIRYEIKDGAKINILYQTSKHWKAVVTYGNRTNTYNVWYYYVNDQVPNCDFNKWDSAKVYTVAQKPTGWNTIADVLGKHEIELKIGTLNLASWLGSFTPDKLCEKSGTDKVSLNTYITGPGGGNIPGFITLGEVFGAWGVAGSSGFTVSGGISFHNSPDKMEINYSFGEKIVNSHQIIYELTGSDGVKLLDWYPTKDDKPTSFDLSEANRIVGDPTLLNITLNSYFQINGTTATGGSWTVGQNKLVASMIVDWIKFSYNNTLTGIKVDNIPAGKSGNDFTVTLKDPERIEIPILSFTGEVDDQAQTVNWKTPYNDGDFSIRKASIRNYAENGTDYTDYTLTIKRPLDTITTLKDISINGVTIPGFDKNKRHYDIHLSSTTKHLPDIIPAHSSSLQTITTAYNESDSVYTITVTPEHGEAKTYTIRFITDLSNDVTLAAISADGITFDPEIATYTLTAETLPKIDFTKKMDGQTVDLRNGILTVTAENGSTGTYTIVCNPPEKQVSSKLNTISLDNEDIQSFDPNTFSYEKSRPDFVNIDPVDDDAQIIYYYDNQHMSWEVQGSNDTSTYSIVYPIIKNPDNTLDAIIIDDQPYTDYDKMIPDYTIPVDSTSHNIVLLPANTKQYINVERKKENSRLLHAIQHNDTILYEITVTSEKGVDNTYKLAFVPNYKNIATLDSIMLNGVKIDTFSSDKFEYNITIPVGDNKLHEPEMPSITYFVSDPDATVQLENGKLGEPTTITVTSADKTTTNIYTVRIQSEPSHNASLTNIVINGTPLDHFEPGRHFYSTTIQQDEALISWASNDNFQTVTLSTIDNNYNLHVVAQDGITAEDYLIEIYNESKSDQPLLSNILLDTLQLNEFEHQLNPKLKFDPMQNTYNITLPSGTSFLPDVNAILLTEGQQMNIEQENTVIKINVTAANGIQTNTYTLNFIIPLSTDATLSMISLGEDSIDNYGDSSAHFIPDEYVYTINLPVGVKEIPEITPAKNNANQTIDPVVFNEDSTIATIHVTAEDSVTTKDYKIFFFPTLSDNDTLHTIYQNGEPLSDFSPSKFNYYVVLPVGTQQFPILEGEPGDDYQTVKQPVISAKGSLITDSTQSDIQTTRMYQIDVFSESKKHNIYTINYEISQSNIDTLQMIYVNGVKLDNFDANDVEYSYTLPANATEMPEVVYIPGDEYQTIAMTQTLDTLTTKSLGKKVSINVTAQNGKTKSYTLHFPLEISSETQLSMINYGKQPLNEFISDVYNYSVTNLDINASDVPIVTVIKKEESQNVEITVADTILNDDNGWKVSIHVVAEDQTHTQDYIVLFSRKKSSNAKLKNIDLTNLTTQTFDSERYEYAIVLNDNETIPQLDYTKAEEGQTVQTTNPILAPDGRYYTSFTVTAPDGESETEYIVTYSFKSYLDQLFVNNENISDFTRDSFEYTIHHKPGTRQDNLYDIENFQFVLSDSLATYEVSQIDNKISVIVTSRDGFNQTAYAIIQEIDKSEENRLERIFLNNDSNNILRNFDPNVDFYSYVLEEGHMAPTIDAFPMDTLSTVTVTEKMVGDTSLIICTSQKGVARKYKILFVYTPINDALTPHANDVLIKVLEGGKIKVATIRKDVSFAIYDIAGKIKEIHVLPTCDPNDAIVHINENGDEKLVDVIGNSGMIIDLLPHRIYFYCFFENQKKKICSGKLKLLE